MQSTPHAMAPSTVGQPRRPDVALPKVAGGPQMSTMNDLGSPGIFALIRPTANVEPSMIVPITEARSISLVFFDFQTSSFWLGTFFHRAPPRRSASSKNG